jgi:hypothetical protein
VDRAFAVSLPLLDGENSVMVLDPYHGACFCSHLSKLRLETGTMTNVRGNEALMANRRYSIALNAQWKFGNRVHAQTRRSAAVAYLVVRPRLPSTVKLVRVNVANIHEQEARRQSSGGALGKTRGNGRNCLHPD